MVTVLEEVLSETLDADHVQRRVDEWEERLNGFYAMIRSWLPEGWEGRPGTPVVMNETIMRQFGIAARKIPTFELHRRTGEIVKFVPRTLWIIDINGRLVLQRKDQRFYIFDTAEIFEPPNWQAARIDRQSDREAVTREWLRRVLQ